jgi:hypothetical protein
VGPRARRRLAWLAGLVIALVVAAAAIALFARSSGNSHAPSTTASRQRSEGVTDHIVFGMTKRQVLRLAGKPRTASGRCWRYSEHQQVAVGSINAAKICFLSGHVSDMSNHFVGGGQPPRWLPAFPVD